MRRLTTAVVVLALAAACGGSPTMPAPLPAPLSPASARFEGVWEIDYRITQCSGLRHCWSFENTMHTFTLRVARGAGGFDGVAMFSNGNNIDVTGSIAGGTLSLRGMRPALSKSDFEFGVSALDLTPEGSSFGGVVEYTNKGPMSSSFYGSSRIGGPIVSVRQRGPITVTAFGGGWSGRLAVRDCSPLGWTDCIPHRPWETHDLDLDLVQQGGVVTGTLSVSRTTVIDVGGTVSGASITIQGTSTKPNYAYDQVTTLRPSTLTLDWIGRLKGAIAFEIAYPPKLPDIWAYKATDFRVVEFLSVAPRTN